MTPLVRGRMETVCEDVVTVTTPGDCVDVLVTDYGNKWTGVVLPNGKRGYMMTEYLQFD